MFSFDLCRHFPIPNVRGLCSAHPLLPLPPDASDDILSSFDCMCHRRGYLLRHSVLILFIVVNVYLYLSFKAHYRDINGIISRLIAKQPEYIKRKRFHMENH